MGITKVAKDKENFARKWEYKNSAREAWSDIIEQYKVQHPNGKILLPSYIGWSANEGSGIFDSVKNADVEFEFYTLDKYLRIDISDFKSKINNNKDSLVLLVHYFGFTDIKYSEIIEFLNQNNIYYVEDCAHSWLSDLIGGNCGKNGKFAFYSLHKILPLEKGGLKVSNKAEVTENEGQINPYLSLNYDLFSIYEKRRANYKYLAGKLEQINHIEILHRELQDGICPQTFPVLLTHADRNDVYHKMNEKGFGMVSLYHTMIRELNNYDAESCSITNNQIINFPVHQDVNQQDLDELIENFKIVLNV